MSETSPELRAIARVYRIGRKLKELRRRRRVLDERLGKVYQDVRALERRIERARARRLRLKRKLSRAIADARAASSSTPATSSSTSLRPWAVDAAAWPRERKH